MYRTETQNRISVILGEDVMHFIHARRKNGLTYRQISGIIYNRTAIAMKPKTLSRWVYDNRRYG